MARAVPAGPTDRLPWLSEPPPVAAPAQRRSRSAFLLMALGAGAAGAAGWTVLQRAVAPEPAPPQVVETVRLPPPVAATPINEPARLMVDERQALSLEPAPSAGAAEPASAPKANTKPAFNARTSSAPRRKTSARKVSSRAQTQPRASEFSAAQANASYDPRAWNSGVQGRIIQLGAFRSPVQANGQWSRVYYRYPLLRPLPPRVVRTNIRGRTYYRLQLGTFSHAHSEMLCQRLRKVGEGCIVLGLNRRGRQA
ncbi:MAG TPA: SPOR domain-containing protein [Sphingomicrobium sp.]|nr:SPOR domain-containing protein [Sphingomicrobium sp.]